MIAVESSGRLGNQLFQFAFGIAAATRLGTSFVMRDDDLRRVFVLAPYRRFGGRVARSLRFRAGQALRPYRVVKIHDETFGDPAEALEHLADRTVYSGLFHSERFFTAVRAQVLAAFTFRPEHERRFQDRYADLLETPYVCCHVRRTDFVTLGVALPSSFYFDALSVLAPADGWPIVFVGDDLVGLKREFGRIKCARFERNDEALDLLLMAGASAVVMANSTFSWWGAYLNRRPGKSVIVPDLGERRSGLQRALPDGWQRVPVGTPTGPVAR